MTPRQPIGACWGRRGSHREASLLPIGRLGVIYDSQPHGYSLFFIAIGIIVNYVQLHCMTVPINMPDSVRNVK